MKNQHEYAKSEAVLGAIERAEKRPDIKCANNSVDGSWDHGDTWLGDWGKHGDYDDASEEIYD